MLRSLFGRPRTVRVPVDQKPFEIQTVKLSRQPNLIITRFLLAGAITGVIFQGIKYADPLGDYRKRDVFREQMDQARKEGRSGRSNDQYGEHWSQQHDKIRPNEPSSSAKSIKIPDGICLTLPIWLRKAPAQAYLNTDPEFREYVQLQSDPKRVKAIKLQVIHSVAQAARQSKRLSMELQLILYKGTIGEFLEIIPQLFPPPTYLLPCVWISTRLPGIEFGWRPMISDAGARVERIFRPLVVFDACRAATWMFFSTTYAITKARVYKNFGIGAGNIATEAPPQIAMPQVPSKNLPGANSNDSAKDKSASLLPVNSLISDIVTNGPATRKMHQDLVSAMPYSLAIQQAAATFNSVKSARQKMAVSVNVRGICQIRGNLNFLGRRGKIRCEVVAYYMPSEDVFVGGIEIISTDIIVDYNLVDKENDRRIKHLKLKNDQARQERQQQQQQQQQKHRDEMTKAFEQHKEQQKSEEEQKTASEPVPSEKDEKEKKEDK